jgi:hypothetical protein
MVILVVPREEVPLLVTTMKESCHKSVCAHDQLKVQYSLTAGRRLNYIQ